MAREARGKGCILLWLDHDLWLKYAMGRDAQELMQLEMRTVPIYPLSTPHIEYLAEISYYGSQALFLHTRFAMKRCTRISKRYIGEA